MDGDIGDSATTCRSRPIQFRDSISNALGSNHPVWKSPIYPACRRRIQRPRAADHAHTRRNGTWPRPDRRRPRGIADTLEVYRSDLDYGLKGIWLVALIHHDGDHVGGIEAVRARADPIVTAHSEETASPTGEREPRKAIHSRFLTLSSCHEIILESRHRIISNAGV